MPLLPPLQIPICGGEGGEPVAGLLLGQLLHWHPAKLLTIAPRDYCTLAADVVAFSLNPAEYESTRINISVDNSSKPSILDCKNCIKVQVLVVAIALLKFSH